MQTNMRVFDAASPEAPGNRRKWNSILKATSEREERTDNAPNEPEIQSNQRLRSESVPEIRAILTPSALRPSGKPSEATCMSPDESLLLSSLRGADVGDDSRSISRMLDISFKWDQSDPSNSPQSPLRSPIVADWKAVGSPIGSNNQEEHIIFDTESASLQVDSSKQGSPESRNRTTRRQRAMSLIEKGTGLFGQQTFSPFDFDEYQLKSIGKASPLESKELDSSVNPAGDSENGKQSIINIATSPDKLAGLFGSQVAQLPQALHEELGVEDANEATEIFKRSSMDSLGVKSSLPESEGSPTNRLSAMPSLFGRMPFGPAAMVFGSSGTELPVDPSIVIDNPEGFDSKSFEPPSRRHSALFGLTDWIPETLGGGGDFSIEEYFNSSTNFSKTSATVGIRRHPRRHSIAATGLLPDIDEQFDFLSLSSANHIESNLSPSAASFHFKGFGSHSASSLLDYMAMSSSADSMEMSSIYPCLPSSSLRDVTFQLSSYKGPLYAVEFKAGRTEIFYVLEIDGKPQLKVRVGDLVIVEADRGEDLGKVTIEISVDKLKQLMMPGSHRGSPDKDSDILTPELAALVHSKEIIPKRIHRLAQSSDLKLLQAKAQEEAIAMVRCQSRIRQKKLPMEVVDAEYQWDRNKLTFYFCADRRIDFRELVRDLFRIYKTRIWMCAVDKSSPRMLMYTSPSGAAGSASLSLGGSECDFGPYYAANFGSSEPSLS